MNSLTGSLECSYMHPIIYFNLLGSIISRKVDSVSLSLYSLKLLSIYIKVQLFEAAVGVHL